jgi:hypothetical protein
MRWGASAGCPRSLPPASFRPVAVTSSLHLVTLPVAGHTSSDVTLFTSDLRSGNMRPPRRNRGGSSYGVAGAMRATRGEQWRRLGHRAGGRGMLVARLQPRRLSLGGAPPRSIAATARKRATQRLHPSVSTLRRCRARRPQSVVLGQRGSALSLAQTSPDTVRLTDAQCVVETRLAHRARGADGLGLLFSPQLLALALEVRRRKEDRSLRTATCSPNLPVFLDALCTHRHTPLPGRTILLVLSRYKEKFRSSRRGNPG